MRRVARSAGVTGAGLAAAEAPSPDLAATVELNDMVSGPFRGTQQFEFGAAGCSFVHQVFDLILCDGGGERHGPRMPGAFHIDTCVRANLALGLFTFDGTFLFVASSGATLNGRVSGTSGTVDATSPEADLELTLTVTGGTPSCFEKAAGEIRLSGSQSLESTPTSG